MGDSNTDEQDLVRALDDVTASLNTPSPDPTAPAPSYGPSSAPAPTPPSSFPTPSPSPVTDGYATSVLTAPTSPAPASSATPLEAIKKDALTELRPLVDKLTVSPEEKFDTYLLLIRSTDDAALIAPAHEAAKSIQDETRRAEALLDIIKEIDYLSQPKKA